MSTAASASFIPTEVQVLRCAAPTKGVRPSTALEEIETLVNSDALRRSLQHHPQTSMTLTRNFDLEFVPKRRRPSTLGVQNIALHCGCAASAIAFACPRISLFHPSENHEEIAAASTADLDDTRSQL